MRSTTWASWATCALAIMIAVPVATADRGSSKKSLADCTSFDQSDKDETTVEFTVHNTCSIPVDCSVSWRVVCAPDSKKRRSAHPAATTVTISDGSSQSAEASAAVCGDDGWVIDSVRWSCEANKD